MSFKIISTNDCIKEYNHPTIPTAINNFAAFEKYWTTNGWDKPSNWIEFQDIEEFSNDQDISHLPTLEEIIEDYLINPDKYAPYTNENGEIKRKMFTCRVKASQVWSSEKSIYDETIDKNGYDRPLEQTKQKQAMHLEHLTELNPITKKPKGFRTYDCMKLAGIVRYEINEETNIQEFTLKKPEGNGRIVKKLITTKGSDVELPFEISFHLPDMTNADMHREEASVHHTDAAERLSQNESQKFASGLSAGLPQYVYCYEFLSNLELDYDNVMNSKRERKALEKWISVSSISMINRGEKEGMFKESKKGNHPGLHYATLGHKVAKEMVEITGEEMLFSSAAQGLASMFSSFCTNLDTTAKNSTGPLFTEELLERFLIEFTTHQNSLGVASKFSSKKDSFKVADLAITSTCKSIEAMCVRIFWKDRAIVNWWKIEKNTKLGFSDENPNIRHFLSKCKDQTLRNEMKRMIVSG